MDFMNNVIDDLIDLSGGDVNKMYQIIQGNKKSNKTNTQKQINKKLNNKNTKQINIKNKH